jgi:sugar transferase (PEP-CTERM/EpsH1 system associated)
MRVAFVAHRVPDRPSKGDKIRSWHELRALAQRHEVHLFALDDAPRSTSVRPEWADAVASAAIEPITGLAPRLRMLRAALSGGALTPAFFAAPRLARALLAALSTRRFDVAVVFSGAVDPLLRGFRPRVLDLVDVDSEKFRLYRERGTVRGLRALACGLEAGRLRALEKRSSEEADLTLVSTQAEASTLRGFAEPRRLEVLGNGVDVQAFPFAPPASRARDELLFVGALDYPANVDACVRLARDLLPRIRREIPGARLTLVGSSPTAAVRALAATPGVSLHADVPCVLPFVERATLALLPLRVARGVQNKALEALASGLPVVASRETTKGLEGEEGRHWLAGETEEELSRLAVAALRDPGLRERLALHGRALVEQCYAWPALLGRFVDLVEEVASGPKSRAAAAMAAAPGRAP